MNHLRSLLHLQQVINMEPNSSNAVTLHNHDSCGSINLTVSDATCSFTVAAIVPHCELERLIFDDEIKTLMPSSVLLLQVPFTFNLIPKRINSIPMLECSYKSLQLNWELVPERIPALHGSEPFFTFPSIND